MRRLLPLAFLLSACGVGDSPGDRPGAGSAAETAVQTASLTGLYDSPGGPGRGQLCILDRGTGDARFGLVARGEGSLSCSGAGSAVRSGNVLRLTMAGDERCTIEAAIEGRRVAFPAALGAGCSYYCAPGATLAGARYEKVGGTAEDSLRAVDLVGDPLCG